MMNNLGGIMSDVIKRIGKGNPNDFLEWYVKQNNVPQSVLNQAQSMAQNALPQIRGMLKK